MRLECTVDDCPNAATVEIAFPDRGGWATVLSCDEDAKRWMGLQGAEIVRTIVV